MNADVHPVRRDLQFRFDFSKLNRWHRSGKNGTHFLNALSIFFPEGERFFIDSVRHYRDTDQIDDARLLEDVRNFIGQEAMHGREHERYNDALEKQGFNAKGKEAVVRRVLKFAQRQPRAVQLSITCALEHLTATLADGLLRHPDPDDINSDPVFHAAWQWHALEETEHKGVAYDVFQRVVGDDDDDEAYRLRVTGHIIANVVFWPMVIAYWVDISRRSGDLTEFRDWLRALNFLVGRRPGTLRRQLPMWFDYFRRGFHPWQHDNREFLTQVDAIAEAHGAAA